MRLAWKITAQIFSFAATMLTLAGISQPMGEHCIYCFDSSFSLSVGICVAARAKVTHAG